MPDWRRRRAANCRVCSGSQLANYRLQFVRSRLAPPQETLRCANRQRQNQGSHHFPERRLDAHAVFPQMPQHRVATQENSTAVLLATLRYPSLSHLCAAECRQRRGAIHSSTNQLHFRRDELDRSRSRPPAWSIKPPDPAPCDADPVFVLYSFSCFRKPRPFDRLLGRAVPSGTDRVVRSTDSLAGHRQRSPWDEFA
jgi:hypothetical protein